MQALYVCALIIWTSRALKGTFNNLHTCCLGIFPDKSKINVEFQLFNNTSF